MFVTKDFNAMQTTNPNPNPNYLFIRYCLFDFIKNKEFICSFHLYAYS